MEANLDQLRYPIGKFKAPDSYTSQLITEYIETLENFPTLMRKAVNGLNDGQLDTPYREDGWTIRQVVHHVADSHLNAYIRFKLAVTEDNPTIKPYDEKSWAELEEAKHGPLELTLPLLEGLHRRWIAFLRIFSAADLKRTFHHPQTNANVSLERTLALYAWHCNHHLAHIIGLKERMSW